MTFDTSIHIGEYACRKYLVAGDRLAQELYTRCRQSGRCHKPRHGSFLCRAFVTLLTNACAFLSPHDNNRKETILSESNLRSFSGDKSPRGIECFSRQCTQNDKACHSNKITMCFHILLHLPPDGTGHASSGPVGRCGKVPKLRGRR
jgi:hypothetical protein